MQGSAEERDGKLYFKGHNPDAGRGEQDLGRDQDDPRLAATRSSPTSRRSRWRSGGEKTYTVKAGDTLSKIAQQQLGDANAYMVIFEANRNLLKDPDKIQAGTGAEDPAVGT